MDGDRLLICYPHIPPPPTRLRLTVPRGSSLQVEPDGLRHPAAAARRGLKLGARGAGRAAGEGAGGAAAAEGPAAADTGRGTAVEALFSDVVLMHRGRWGGAAAMRVKFTA